MSAIKMKSLISVSTLKKSHAQQITILDLGRDEQKTREVYKLLEARKIVPLGWCRNALPDHFSDYVHVLLVEYKERLYWIKAPGDNYDNVFNSEQLFIG